MGSGDRALVTLGICNARLAEGTARPRTMGHKSRTACGTRASHGHARFNKCLARRLWSILETSAVCLAAHSCSCSFVTAFFAATFSSCLA